RNQLGNPLNYGRGGLSLLCRQSSGTLNLWTSFPDVKVVEHGSFSEAARSLRLSRSAVSKYVIDLEQELGVQLLNRTTRSASPTENGRAYYERALSILADVEEADLAVTRLQAEPRGLLRINAPMSFGTIHLGPALADFMEKYPELQIQLMLSDEQIDA